MKWIRLILLCLCLIWLFKSFVRAQGSSSDLITATIQISVCGNGIIEGGEDCEGDDLGRATCESLGYGSGVLVCDIACSFDTYSCSPAPVPTPTPSPIPSPTPTSTPTLTPTPTSTTAPTSTPVPTSMEVSIPILTPTPTAIPTPRAILPLAVAAFDIDGSGRIEITEVFTAVKSWVTEWRMVLRGEQDFEKCDLNHDGVCNLLDFSILMYYIER